MKTYLISQEQIKQFVVLLVIAMLAVFFAGYYLGGQGQKGSSMSAKNIDITNAVDTEVDTRILENSPANIKDNTEKAKSEQNETTQKNKVVNAAVSQKADSHKTDDNKKKAEQQAIERKKAEKKKAEKRKVEKKKAEEKTRKEAAKKAEARKKSAQKDKASKAATLKQPEKTPQLSVISSVNLKPGQRYYSIQAGMFASKVNASSFIDKLAEKDFKAYVSNFVSTSGAIKYNVRVGRFEKRQQARVLLREFQKHFSSPAYVVISDR